MSTKVSALTQATNTELADASLAYVVIDPSGTPASRKSTLARIGTKPRSLIEAGEDIFGLPSAPAGYNGTIGLPFIRKRASQTCTGVRVKLAYATALTLKVSLYPWSGAALATANISYTGPGTWEGTFATAVSLSAGTVYKAAVFNATAQPYAWSMTSAWITGLAAGNKFWDLDTRPIEFRDYYAVNWVHAVGADSNPNVVVPDTVSLVEPIISG